MSALELQQRGLLKLLKNRGDLPDDPYLRRVAHSRELKMVRKIALWWRAFALQGQCYFTTRLLTHLGCFDALVASYFDQNATSPFVEELSLDFLSSLHGHGDGLVRATSQFEHALLAVRAGSTDTFDILWDRNPDLVVLALETGGELPPCEPGCRYIMHVGNDISSMIMCERKSIQIVDPPSLATAAEDQRSGGCEVS